MLAALYKWCYCEELHFIQAGAPIRLTFSVRAWLDNQFTGMWIGRGGLRQWFLPSIDLIHYTVVPPYPRVIRSKTYRGCPKPRIVANPIYIYIYIYKRVNLRSTEVDADKLKRKYLNRPWSTLAVNVLIFSGRGKPWIWGFYCSCFLWSCAKGEVYRLILKPSIKRKKKFGILFFTVTFDFLMKNFETVSSRLQQCLCRNLGPTLKSDTKW
jgi:hypothetical protein